MTQKYKDLPIPIKSCYNPEQKAKYIHSLEERNIRHSSLHSYVSVFVSLATYEKYYKSDILYMSKNKIAAIFEMTIKSYAMFTNYCTTLRDYYSFYGKNFDDVYPDFNTLDISGNMENRFIKDYDMLIDILSKAFPLKYGSLDEFRKLAIMLCYLGFKKQEIRMIKKSEVNLFNHTISHKNHFIDNVPHSCISLCKQCMNMDEVYLNNTAHLPDDERVYFPLCNNEYLIRSRFVNPQNIGEPIPDRWLSRAMVSLNSSVNGDYSFDNIRASGLYAWLYKKEQLGEFNSETTGNELRKIYREYFKSECSIGNLSNNYKIWKQIFYGY